MDAVPNERELSGNNYYLITSNPSIGPGGADYYGISRVNTLIVATSNKEALLKYSQSDGYIYHGTIHVSLICPVEDLIS
jgi:hypothetical protein